MGPLLTFISTQRLLQLLLLLFEGVSKVRDIKQEWVLEYDHVGLIHQKSGIYSVG